MVEVSTCKKEGTKNFCCQECGALIRSEKLPKSEHTWDDGVVTTPPAPGKEGELTYTCGDCGDTVTEPIAPVGVLGDVDGNNLVNSTDARLVLQYAVGKIGNDALAVALADVDGNNLLNSTDARLILQYAVGKIQQFPGA